MRRINLASKLLRSISCHLNCLTKISRRVECRGWLPYLEGPSGFFLGGNSRYESAIALRAIHERFSRAAASATRRLNNGGKRKYAKTIADSTAPTTLTLGPKREAKTTSTATKPRGTSTRDRSAYRYEFALH